MNFQHIENLLIRYRGRVVHIKTTSGGAYEGSISDVTNDYVDLKVTDSEREDAHIIIMLHGIESISP